MKKLTLIGLFLLAGCSFAQAAIFNPPSPWNRNGTSINYAGGNVGIGSTTPTSKFQVVGTIAATAFSGSGAVPQGVIALWSGSIATIPTGWEISDGTCLITCPDLRNLFVVGADADAAGVAKSTVTGSALQTGGSTTIAQANLPSYNLTFTARSPGGDGPNAGSSANGGNGNTINVSSGGSGTAYTQPFYALAYIIKD